jgi:3-hydroxy-3-methylglutaryl CoA synthase
MEIEYVKKAENSTVPQIVRNRPDIGIERMVITTPGMAIQSAELESELGFENGKISGGLRINEVRLPGITENNSTMVANGLYRFIKDAASDKETMAKLRKEPIRSIYFATESNPDRSRPEIEPSLLMVASCLPRDSVYEEIAGMLKRARVVPITYACVGGVLALGEAINDVAVGAYTSQKGSSLVISVDTSVYSDRRAKNAEGTQGAAAALMWITENPSLVSFPVGVSHAFHGPFSDFTKYGEETPLVHSTFSKIMYVYAVAEAFEDAELSAEKMNIDNMNFIIAHVPFPKQTEYFIGFLYAHYLRRHDPGKLSEIERREGVGEEPLAGAEGFTDLIRRKIGAFNSKGAKSDLELIDLIEKDAEISAYWNWTGALRKQKEFHDFEKRLMIDKALSIPSLVGNSYSASVFVSLASLLSNAPSNGSGDINGVIIGYGSGAQAVERPLAIHALQTGSGKLVIDMGTPYYLNGKSYRELHDKWLVKGEAARMVRHSGEADLLHEEKRFLSEAKLSGGFHVRRKNPDGTGEYFYVDESGRIEDIRIRT